MPSLYCHPDAPAGAIQAIDAELERMNDGAIAIFHLRGDVSRLVIPGSAKPERADNLWRTTCFELFVADDGESYREYNFSLSGQWAAYRFANYRTGMSNADASVKIEVYQEINKLQLNAKIKGEFPSPAHVGLTAVIEEAGGSVSYWSTAFAPGKPDFHAAAVRSLLFDGVSAE